MRSPRYRAALTMLFLLLAGCTGGTTLTTTPTTVEATIRGTTGAPTAASAPIATTTRPADPAGAAVEPGRGTATHTPPASAATGVTPTLQYPAPDATLRGPLAGVTALAWSPDGRRVAAAAGDVNGPPDLRVYLWDASGASAATLAGHTEPVTSLAWSPDGRLLATGSWDGTVRLWDATGAAVRTLVGPPEPPSDPPPPYSPPPVFGLAWSPDGGTPATGAISFRPADTATPTAFLPLPGLVRLWHPDGTLAATLMTDHTGGKFLNLAWSPDGALLTAGAMDYRIWRADGTPVATFRELGTPAWALAWSPDSRTLAISDEDATVALYTAAGTLIERRWDLGGAGGVAFAPDGRTLAVNDHEDARLGDPSATPAVGSRTPPLPQDRNPTSRYRAVWSPDGRLATVERDRIVRLWHADGAALAALDGCDPVVDVLAWSPDGTRLAAGARSGAVCLWRTPIAAP